MTEATTTNKGAQPRKDETLIRSKKKLFIIRATFVSVWLFFSSIVFLIAILTDINWARPNLEDFMASSLHRNVKLGHLYWHFGFKGLTLETSRLLVAEPSGEPFLMAGNCEIGLAFWPLLLGKGTIHHFDLQNVLFMAVRTGEHHWNFDDLLVTCPDVEFVDCHHGHAFVIDRKPANSGMRFPDTELNDVEIKLHRAGNFKPGLTHISFALPAEKTEPARFQFISQVWNKDKSWWLRNNRFHLDCQHFSLQNWQALFAVVSADKQNSSWLNTVCGNAINNTYTNKAYKLAQTFVKGLFDITADAEGIPSQKLKIDFAIKASDLAYIHPNKTISSLPEINSSAKIYFEPNYFKVNRFNLRVPNDDLILNCSGEQKTTKEDKEKTTQGEIVALLGNLNKVGSFINLADMVLPKTFQISSDNLPDGKLLFSSKFSKINEQVNSNWETTISDCKISRALTWLQTTAENSDNASFKKSAANLLQQYLHQDSLEVLCFSKQAKFTGTAMFRSDEGFTLKDCLLSDGAVAWKLSGKANQSGNWSELQLSSKNLPLAKFSTLLSNNRRLANRVADCLGLSSGCQITLSGKGEVTAKFSEAAKDSEDKQNHLSCQTLLTDADFHLSKPSLSLHHMNGIYTMDNDEFILKNLQANTSAGMMTIDADLPTKRNKPIDFHLHATNIALSELAAILQLFHMDTKFLSRWQLSGNLKEMDLVVAGTASKPVIHFTGTPENVDFSLSDLPAIMHATSGKVTYNNDILVIDKVSVSSQSSNFVASLTIKNLESGPTLDKLSASIANADLSDLQQCLPSEAKLPNFKNLAESLSNKLQVSNLKGKVSGNVEYGRRGEQNLRGYLDLDNISLRYGARKLFFHNLKGKIIFSGNDLICHNISGSLNNSPVSLEGRLINYQNKLVQWRGDSSIQVSPSDLPDAFSLLVSPEHGPSIKTKSKKSIVFRIKSNIAQSTYSHTFTLIADPDASLYFSCDNFCFQQPNNTKLAIIGSCRKDDQQLLCHYLSFDFAGSQIIFKGSIRNNTNALNLLAQIPEFTEASLLEETFCHGLLTGPITGQIRGALSIQGTPNAPQIGGKIILADISMPGIYINHINGDLALQPTPPTGAQPSLVAQIHFKELNLGLAPLQKASGTLGYSASIYVLKDFTAELAKGKLTATGKVDLEQKNSNLELNVANAQLAQLWPRINNSQIDIEGPLDCHFSLSSSGDSPSELEANLAGSGTIHVGRGSFNRSGLLHARLNQVNLIHQGISGFNVNNLLQSVVPAKTSEFYSIDGAFGLTKEVLTIRSILYDSRDLKFSAAGKANLSLNSLELDVAGVMPRVSTSVIHGPLGELSREITLQKFLDSLTLHKLDKLPSLPLIGGIGNKTDLFTCRIVAPYNQPKLISQSIQKSFQWLNYKAANAPTKHAQ
jgi:hypothetical protein